MNDLDPEKVGWLEPWSPVKNQQHAAWLERELKKEVVRGHVLFGRAAMAVAVRADQDDVLFQISDPTQLAVVHLTWAARADRPPWPSTSLQGYERVRSESDECRS